MEKVILNMIHQNSLQPRCEQPRRSPHALAICYSMLGSSETPLFLFKAQMAFFLLLSLLDSLKDLRFLSVFLSLFPPVLIIPSLSSFISSIFFVLDCITPTSFFYLICFNPSSSFLCAFAISVNVECF